MIETAEIPAVAGICLGGPRRIRTFNLLIKSWLRFRENPSSAGRLHPPCSLYSLTTPSLGYTFWLHGYMATWGPPGCVLNSQ